MKALGFALFILATGALALPTFAQEAASPPFSTSFATVSAVSRAPLVVPVEPPREHKFFDRRQLFALYVHSGMRVADTIKTCRSLSHGGVEDWIPTQSCGGVAAWQAGSIGLTLGVGWLFHRSGHHRLERITPWVGTTASAAGWTKSVLNIH